MTTERLHVSLFLLLYGGSNQPNLGHAINILHMRNVNDTHECSIWRRVQQRSREFKQARKRRRQRLKMRLRGSAIICLIISTHLACQTCTNYAGIKLA